MWGKIHDKTSDLYDELRKVYPEYIAKAEKKGRTKTEVDEIIRWLTGYSQEAFEAQLENRQTWRPLLRKRLN
jgi:hypothetical protein